MRIRLSWLSPGYSWGGGSWVRPWLLPLTPIPTLRLWGPRHPAGAERPVQDRQWGERCPRLLALAGVPAGERGRGAGGGIARPGALPGQCCWCLAGADPPPSSSRTAPASTSAGGPSSARTGSSPPPTAGSREGGAPGSAWAPLWGGGGEQGPGSVLNSPPPPL